MSLTSTRSSGRRSMVRSARRGLLLLPIGLFCLIATAAPPPAAVRISEIAADPGAGGSPAIELFNDGSNPASLNGAVIAVDDQLVTLSGLADTAPGGTVVIRWNQTGVSGGSELFTGPMPPLDPASGSVALFKSSHVQDAGELLAYVQWGSGDAPRAALAGQAELWDPAAVLPPMPAGESLALLPGSDGRSAAEWTLAAPTLGAPNSFSSSAFGGWSLVGAAAVQEPALAASPAGLELISAGAGGSVQHYRLAGDAWSLAANLGGSIARAPALAASPDGTLELATVGTDGQVLHNRFLSGQWGSFLPTGGKSALPAALAVNPAAGTTELVLVAPDGQLQHSRFRGNAWSGFAPVGSAGSAPPALLFNPAAGMLDLLFSGPDGTVSHARFDGGAWSVLASTQGQSLLRPALVSLPDGTLEAAISAADGTVCMSRFLGGVWESWQPIAGATSDLPPTLVYDPVSHSTELFFVGRDHLVRQARRTAVGWGAAASIGAAAEFPVAAASNGDAIDLVITGRDGNLWHNRFQPGPAMPGISFANDVQPIFNAHCGCHTRGGTAAGLDLRPDVAYEDLVGAPSFQADMNQIEPGSPEKSYLLHKLDGTQLDAGGTGSQMPLGRPPLEDGELSTLRRWIEQGAPNN